MQRRRSQAGIGEWARGLTVIAATAATMVVALVACGDDEETTGPQPTGGTAGSGGSGGQAAAAGDGGLGGQAGQGQGGQLCDPGVREDCYEGPDGTEGVGICAGGERMCNPEGTAWGECLGQALPQTEDCTAAGDEDCDGVPCSETIWSMATGSAGQAELGHAVAYDTAGNVAVAGSFAGSLNFGCGLHSPAMGPSYPVIVAKFAPGGGCVWSKQFGTPTGHSYGYGVAFDGSGHVVATGTFQGAVDFNPTLTAGGDRDGFLIKLDSADGHTLWARQLTNPGLTFAPTGEKIPKDVVVDGSGGVYLAGYHNGTWGSVAFQLGTFGDAVFVKKYDSGGNLDWTWLHDGNGMQRANGLAVGSSGNIALVGTFDTTIVFEQTHTGPASPDNYGYVAVLDSSQDPVWSHSFGQSAEEQAAMDVAIDSNGALWVAGHFESSLRLSASTTLTSDGDTDAFLAKYSSTGTHLWGQDFGDDPGTFQVGYGVAVDSQDNVVLAGRFDSGIDLGGGRLVAANGEDIFLGKFENDGSFRWSRRFGGAGTDHAAAVTAGAGDQIALTGHISSAVDFGTGPVSYAGGIDAFVAAFHP